MTQKIFFPTRYFTMAALLGLSVIGCTNDDKGKSDSTTVVETNTDTSMLMRDSSMNTTPVADTTTAKMNKGTAKPNPSKKGMKGKAIVVAPSKSTGNMEMDKTGVYENVEYVPSFPGGNDGLQKYFDDNLVYPEAASNEGVDGTVKVSFIVDETGKLSSPQVVGDKLGYGLEDEALRVVQKMPVWNPGKLKGKNVKTRYTLLVRFQLQ